MAPIGNLVLSHGIIGSSEICSENRVADGTFVILSLSGDTVEDAPLLTTESRVNWIKTSAISGDILPKRLSPGLEASEAAAAGGLDCASITTYYKRNL